MASELVGAERYERAAGRDAYHSGSYARRLVTGAGGVDLSVPKLCGAFARTVRDGFAETLAYTEFPPEHWRRIRTNNGIEHISRETRRRTRVVGTFPDGNSALLLVATRLKHIVEHERGKRRYLDMSKLEKMDELKGKAEGQKRTGPRTAKSICERIFTVPSMKLVCELHRRAKRSNDRRIKAHIALSLARISQLKERARDNRQVSQFLENG